MKNLIVSTFFVFSFAASMSAFAGEGELDSLAVTATSGGGAALYVSPIEEGQSASEADASGSAIDPSLDVGGLTE